VFKNVESYLKSAAKGSTFVFLGTISSILLWFATKVLIIRYTTKEELGIYSLAVAVVGLIGLIAGAGLQDGSTRFISLCLSEGREKDADAVSKGTLQLSMIFGATASLLLIVAAGPLARHSFYMPELITPFRVIAFFAFFQVVSGALVGIIRGYGIISPRVYFINIGQPLFFLLLLAIFFALGFSYLCTTYSFVLAMILSCVGIGAYGYRKIRLNPLVLRGGDFRKELLRFSIPLVGVAAMAMILNWTDTLMLGRYTGAEDVGVYSVSVSLARLLTFALSAVGFVFMPLAGEMYARKQTDELKITYQILTKWIFATTLPVFFVLFLFPEMTITFLFGERYVVSSDALRVLSLGFMFSVFVGANNIPLIIMGRSKSLMNVSIFSAVLNIILNYVFISMLGYGVMGASSATAVSYFFMHGANALILYRVSGIHPITSRYLKPIVGSAIIGLMVYAIAQILPPSAWMLPVYFVVFVAGYLCALLLSRSLEREDIAMFESISRKTGLNSDFLRKVLMRFAHE
jgi:O-antigen/teichoic acid export membrane protein